MKKQYDKKGAYLDPVNQGKSALGLQEVHLRWTCE